MDMQVGSLCKAFKTSHNGVPVEAHLRDDCPDVVRVCPPGTKWDVPSKNTEKGFYAQNEQERAERASLCCSRV